MFVKNSGLKYNQITNIQVNRYKHFRYIMLMKILKYVRYDGCPYQSIYSFKKYSLIFI